MPERPERGELSPESRSLTEAHEAGEVRGSLKTPLYQTSTFVFGSAEEGKRFFELAYGLDEAEPGETGGYLYSRLDNPNLRVVEARLSAWERSEDSLLFNSGMAAISTVFLSHLKPGDLVVSSSPLYGGTSKLLNGVFSDLGIETMWFNADADEEGVELRLAESDQSPAMVYVETPSNPTNHIFDLAMFSRIAQEHGAKLVVDNTFLSAIGQRPLDHGADLVVQSATKYLGGHSDLTAGVVSGGEADIEYLRHMRYRLGSTASPMTAWLLTRSLETFRLRVEKQTSNATAVAGLLVGHPKVGFVRHLSQLEPGTRSWEIYEKQCLSPGAMVSFEVEGGEEAAFRFLNGCRLIHQATSLGGTESLASHPWSTSHSTVPETEKRAMGITEGLIRLSVGVEADEDLLLDVERALDSV